MLKAINANIDCSMYYGIYLVAVAVVEGGSREETETKLKQTLTSHRTDQVS